MAADSSMAGGLKSSCINHPTIEAIGRCKQCGKPYCSTCEVVGATGRFCSEECQKSHEVFVQRAAKLDNMRAGSGFFGKLIVVAKRVLAFAIGLVIILVVLAFLGVDIPVVSPMLNDALGR
jgi:hypothetical protein